jgi:hypothetical protein
MESKSLGAALVHTRSGRDRCRLFDLDEALLEPPQSTVAEDPDRSR